MKNALLIVLLAVGFVLLFAASGAGAELGALVISQKVQQLAAAIAEAEGFGPIENIPTRAKNPGDLAVGDHGYGTLGPSRVTVFAEVAEGWNALYKMLAGWVSGQSSIYILTDNFATIGHKYVDGPNAPTVSQESQNWAANVASALGIDTATTLGDWYTS